MAPRLTHMRMVELRMLAATASAQLSKYARMQSCPVVLLVAKVYVELVVCYVCMHAVVLSVVVNRMHIFAFDINFISIFTHFLHILFFNSFGT